jgi:hypothetical protein
MGLLRTATRLAGFVLLGGALYPFLQALRWLDRREYVAAVVATVVGWLVCQSGVELLRPESAE